jgi:hypothetical protein
MKKLLLFICAVSFVLSGHVLLLAQSEMEPNNFFATAQPLADNTITECSFTNSGDADVFMLEMSVDSIYHIYTSNVLEGCGSSLKAQLFFEADTATNIFYGDPSSRGTGSNLRVAGWAPILYGSGTYYLKITHPASIDGDGSYKVRIIANSMAFWAYYHEPDNTFAESFAQLPLPTDGVRYFGMLFDPAEIPTGKNDIDSYYMIGEQGQRLWVETEPFTGYPNIRDMDSKIYVWDADGSEGIDENDDKNNQEESFDVFVDKKLLSSNNNVFSTVVVDSLPYSGIFYVIVTSFYSAYNGEAHTDSDPSTGGYYVYSWAGWDDAEREPNNSMETATPLAEPIPESARVSNLKNMVIDGKFESESDVDWYAFQLKTTKMYEFCTTESSVGADIKLEVYSVEDPATNLVDDSVNDRYSSNDFRLTGWIPPKNGVYYFKLTPSAGAVGGGNTGDYKLRMGWSVYRNASMWDEPNNAMGEAVVVDFDSATYARAIYPADDVDWFKFTGTAGDEIAVVTRSPLGDSTWARDFDTKISVYDPSGTIKENDDFRVEGVTHPNSTYSAVLGYALEATGTVYIKVEGYYKSDETGAGKNNVGMYELIVYSTAAAPGFWEKETNDVFANATNWPEDKSILAKFTKGGLPNADDVDIYSMNMTNDRMYFINSTESVLGENMQVELFSENDTTTNMLDSDVSGRYNDGDFRISGFIPPESGKYYVKVSVASVGTGSYSLRRRSTLLQNVVMNHEPDNSTGEADMLGTYPVDGVSKTFGLYNDADPEKENDVDIFRLDCISGQTLVATTAPVGGSEWYRDVDTKIHLTKEDGTEVASNDDFGGMTYSSVSVTIPDDGIYYLHVYSFYSTANGLAPEEVTHRDPGVGDYLLTISGTMSETEPNNSAGQANAIPVSNSNLIEAAFSGFDIEDWFKVDLEAAKVYYFSSTESNLDADIHLEVYSENDTETNLIDAGVDGRYSSQNFRLSGWSPPEDGTYLLRIYVEFAAISTSDGKYKFRAAGGELMADLESAHEPDNTTTDADAQGFLATDSTIVWAGVHDENDFDLYAIQGVQGQKLTCEVFPANGERWIRDVDTKISLYQDDGVTLIDDNDDWDNWYELVFYSEILNEGCSNTYSRVVIDSLPYSGTYYLDVYSYYSLHNGETPSFSKPHIGSYKLYAVMKAQTGVADEDNMLPKEFSLGQNYPNPFNPTTSINYSLANVTDVKITIYNVMGQKVITLLDENQVAGRYSIQWNGQDRFGQHVSSGVYLYRIEAGDKFIKTKKMMFLK